MIKERENLFSFLEGKAKLIEPSLVKSLEDLKGSRLLYESARYAVSSGGKRIRPTLAMVSAELCGGDEEKVLPAAVAYELLHNCTLIHDDIMEKASIRRGKPTVRAKFGEGAAIVLGDVMFSVAYGQLHQLSKDFMPVKVLTTFNYFNTTCSMLAKGAMKEAEMQRVKHPTAKDYFYAVDNKTSSLIVGPLKTGALLSNAGDEELEALEAFGYCFGRVFQMRDDVLDLKGSKGFGKEKGMDVREGKRTLLVIYALDALAEKERKQLLEILDKPKKSEKDVLKALTFIEKSGAVEKAQTEAERIAAQGVERLERFGDSKERRILESLMEFALQREF